jgi:hypothetical protein
VKINEYPSREEIFELFDKEEILNNCRFVWIKSHGNLPSGSEAGYLDGSGYHRIQFNFKTYARHRLMWIAHFGDIPEGYIVDHIDDHLDGLNDHISNLQLITHRENVSKSTLKTTSNVYKTGKKWRVQFNINGVRKVFGVFPKKEKAIEQANRIREILKRKGI